MMNNNFDPNLFNMMLNMMNVMYPNMGYNMNNYNMNNYQNLMNIIMNNQMLLQMYQNMQNNMNPNQNINNRMNFINVNQNQMNNNQVNGGGLGNNNANFTYNVSSSMNLSPVTNIIFTTMKEQKANLVAPIDMKIKDLLYKYVTKLGLGPNVIGSSLFFLYNGKKINYNEEKTIHEYGLENAHIIVLDPKEVIGSS
jgi:hypothetical protein